MANILAAYLLPHPPIILKEIGKGKGKQAEATINGMEEIAKDIKKKAPDTIIIITPHGPLFRDAIAISVEADLKGDFARFGHKDLEFNYKNNTLLTEKIIKKSIERGIGIIEVDEKLSQEYNIEKDLDHGSLVPLYFVDKEYSDYQIVHITYGLLNPKVLFEFGQIIEEAVKEREGDVILIASGDLSHKLSKDGPYDYSADGKIFDEKILEIIKDGKIEDLVSFDLDLAESAGECGLRSLIIMAGAIDKYRLKTQVLSYEAPFGVGYATALLDIVDEESYYVKLAKKSLEYYIRNGKHLPEPENTIGIKKGVFVSLKKNNMLRGCIGTIVATRDSIELEIIQNAVSAGLEDPRFPSVREEELDELVYSVDVLEEAEIIESMDQLDIKKYGVIVTSGYRRGLLLPNLEGVDSVEQQVAIALEKANIGGNEKYQLERFEVKRYY